MKRLVALLLMLGLIASTPFAIPAQDKKDDDKKTEEKKVEEKKTEEKKTEETKTEEKKGETPKVEEKKTEESKTEMVKTTTPRPSAPHAQGEQNMLEKAYAGVEPMLPIINLTLLAVVFALLLNLRGTVAQLEEKLKG